MSRSIRMTKYATDSTLNGYVFSDFQHARQWLTQVFVDPETIKLEEVEVGPRCECRTCGGTGFRQDIKAVRKLTVAEFLSGVSEA